MDQHEEKGSLFFLLLLHLPSIKFLMVSDMFATSCSTSNVSSSELLSVTWRSTQEEEEEEERERERGKGETRCQKRKPTKENIEDLSRFHTIPFKEE